MYENLTPQERLERVARLLVKAMYSYGDAVEYARGGEETRDEEHPRGSEESDKDSGTSAQQELPLSEAYEFRSRRIGEVGRGQRSKGVRQPST